MSAQTVVSVDYENEYDIVIVHVPCFDIIVVNP